MRKIISFLFVVIFIFMSNILVIDASKRGGGSTVKNSSVECKYKLAKNCYINIKQGKGQRAKTRWSIVYTDGTKTLPNGCENIKITFKSNESDFLNKFVRGEGSAQNSGKCLKAIYAKETKTKNKTTYNISLTKSNGYKKITLSEDSSIVGGASAIKYDCSGTQIVDYAKKFEGNGYYTMGGNVPTGKNTKIDCSGFTQYVFKHFKINLPRHSKDQAYSSVGSTVSSLKTALPGDLIYYENPRHVSIYMGNNKQIHSTYGATLGRKQSIRISEITKKPTKIVRFCDTNTTLKKYKIDPMTAIKIRNEFKSCKQMLSDEFWKQLNYIFLIIKIATPVILVILTMIDLVKIVFNDEVFGNYSKIFLKRLVIALAIFLLPYILTFIFDVTGISDGVCGIK